MSANRSHLVAEPRVNKLGQTVIKHVKPAQDQPTGKSSIPSPIMASMSSSPAVDRDEAIDRLVAQINPSYLYGSGSTITLKDALGEVSDDYFAVIAAASDRDRDENNNNRQLSIYQVAVNLREHEAREVLYLMPAVPNWVDTGDSIRYIRGLRHLDMFKDKETLEGIAGEEHVIAAAILDVAPFLSDEIETECLAYGEDGVKPWIAIKNPEFLKLIVENPHKTDMMMDFIEERGIDCTFDMLREYIENDTPLRDGIL